MRRREFIALLGGLAAGWPFRARAQQQAMPVVGYLHAGSSGTTRNHVAAFQRGLSEIGFVERRNVTIEYRWADSQYDRLPELVTDLIRHGVAVIAAPSGTATALAAQPLTRTIPIVFSTAADPVQTGLVGSLNHPAGNITGITDMSTEIAAKQLGLLHELLPGAEHFGLLMNPTSPLAEPTISEVQAAASAIGGQVQILAVRTGRDIDMAFESIVQNRIEALLIGPDSLFTTRRVQLVTLVVRHAVPAIFWMREFAEAGGLMSYGSSIIDRERQLGIYVGRILRGEKAADLPVLRASKFEFVVNLQTAKVLGIELPATLLARADEVIE